MSLANTQVKLCQVAFFALQETGKVLIFINQLHYLGQKSNDYMYDDL